MWPESTVVPAWRNDWKWPTGFETICVYACALGLIHPREPRWDADSEAAARDLAVMDRLLRSSAGARVHIVFVSSVLTLQEPRPIRSYYCGWKRVIEGRLIDLAARTPATRLSVLYPGRLVAGKSMRRPLSLAHTTYARLAELLPRFGTGAGGRRALVGADARTWMIARGAAAMARAITRG